jgi:hypothetical protein
MKRLLTIIIVLFSVITIAKAQVYYEEATEEQQEEQVNDNSLSYLSFAERSYFGGNFGLSFGTNTYVELNPLWGYMVNRNLSVGLGGTYIYSSRELIDITGQRFTVNSNLYGARTFLRYRIFNDIYFHGEYESINNELIAPDGTTTRDWVNGAFVGGGIFQPVFGRGGASVFILYNLLHDDFRSPYASPWVIRVGFTF